MDVVRLKFTKAHGITNLYNRSKQLLSITGLVLNNLKSILKGSFIDILKLQNETIDRCAK